MQEFKEALKILEDSKEFKEWKKKNPECYLSYGFFIVDKNSDEWKIGYCRPKTNEITSFVVGSSIKIEPSEEAFQKEKKKIEGIYPGDVKLGLAEAVAVANDVQKEEFSAEDPKKIVAILQKLDAKQIWNVTFLTQSFNTLNIKIRSDNGEVVEKKLQPLFAFEK